MNSFPNEILSNIFRHLHLLHKLECMLVCHRWEHILRNESLLDTVPITSFMMLNRFLELLRKQPSRGAQVKQLLLHDCFSRDADQVLPFHLFSNLEFFYLNTPKNHLYMNIHYLGFRGEFLARLRDCIQHIADYFDSIFIWDLLASGTCSRLSTIKLNFLRNSDPSQFFDLLSNASALKTLELRGFRFNLAHFEKIHTNTPSLSSLHLKEGSFQPGSSFSDDISPAKNMKRITLSISTCTDRSLLALMKYICKKYPSLSHFSYPVYNDFPRIIDQISREGSVQNYKDGLSLLLHTFGPQLNQLSYSVVQLGQYYFEELDEYGCQMQTLHGSVDCSMVLFKRLFDRIPPYQCSYIQKLVLYNLEDFNLELLRDMAVLKSLTLRYKRNSNKNRPVVNLNHLLDTCSNTLRELEIYGVRLECDDDPSLTSTKLPFSINKLKIISSETSSAFDTFIRYSCPVLRFLSLIHSFPSNGKLMLYYHKLTCLEIETAYTNQSDGNNILVRTSIDKKRLYPIREKKYYKYIAEHDPDGYKFLLSKRLEPLSNIHQMGLFISTVACHSIDDLYINGYTVY
ncbi:hypothetical protein K501DRAFT_265736 [Backusella circina FSU 941]|nr:hypothetical protein K501DRAFT_265736 [Backusella circina FSU 941]